MRWLYDNDSTSQPPIMFRSIYESPLHFSWTILFIENAELIDTKSNDSLHSTENPSFYLVAPENVQGHMETKKFLYKI